MAFVGAGTASAETTLCRNEAGTECLGVGTVAEGHTINTPGFTNGKAVLTSGSFFGANLECRSTFSGKIETATTPAVPVEKKALTWTECVGGLAETVKGGELVFHHEMGTASNGTITPGGFAAWTEHVGIQCYWSSKGVTGTFIAGAAPKIEITAEPEVVHTTEYPSDPLCPLKAGFHATYEITKPIPAYMVTGV